MQTNIIMKKSIIVDIVLQ